MQMTINPHINIRAERVRAGMTQLDMAKRLGMSVTAYNLKESGKRQFSLDEFILICEILDTDPDTLLAI